MDTVLAMKAAKPAGLAKGQLSIALKELAKSGKYQPLLTASPRMSFIT